MPGFSIVLPTNRRDELFVLALSSTLEAMSFADAELVVVGDGIDVDDLNQLPGVKAIQSPSSGIVSALNAGVAAARARFIFRMDGDDVCHRARFARVNPASLIEDGVGLVAGDIVKFGDVAARREFAPFTQSALVERLLHCGYAFAHPASGFSRAEFERVGGYRLSADGVEDLDLWLRMLDAGVRYAHLRSIATFYRSHSNQVTRSGAGPTVHSVLAAREASQDPCSSRCPGRLASFEAMLLGDSGGVCPRWRHRTSLRALSPSERLLHPGPSGRVAFRLVAEFGSGQLAVRGGRTWGK